MESVCTLVLTLCLAGTSLCHIGNSQTSLIDKLFSRNNYSKEVRPVCEFDEAIDVKVGIAFRQIIELLEPKQILTFNAWIRMSWDDCRLRWDKKDYNNLTKITIPVSNIWEPDITLYDYADNENEKIPGFGSYLATVHSNGDVVYMFPTVIHVFCKVDVTYFPFDKQICPLKFSSWAYDGFAVNVVNRSMEGGTSHFQPHVEWDLVGVPMETIVTVYSCCDAPYPEIVFSVTLRRKLLFYMTNLLFPCALITAISAFGFLLPSDSGEKVSLEVTALLSLAVFLLVVTEQLPASSESFPLIGIYFTVTMVLVAVSTLLTVFILNIHHKGQQRKEVPKWLYRIAFNFLGPILCVNSKFIKSDENREGSDSCYELPRQKPSHSNGNSVQFNKDYSSTCKLASMVFKSSDNNTSLGLTPKIKRASSQNGISAEELIEQISLLLFSHKEVLQKQLQVMERNEAWKERHHQQD